MKTLIKVLVFKAFGPKVFTKIPMEDIPEVRTWDPFSSPVLESGIGKAQPKKYKNGIERMQEENLLS